jgi:myo-inositol 2-dehydrogenase/D-chiro-inositol 1-dehydrogenase/scyllo-inositol 2-dehydrogenase (NAD+)
MTPIVRVCLVGAGRAAHVHANSLVNHLPKGELVAIVDSQSEVLQEAGALFQVNRLYTSLEAALNSVDFDAVVITTPTFTHMDLAVTAASAGKHVFLEKPMALNLAECDAILHAAQTSKIILQLGFMRRFDPEFSEAARRIESGVIGQPMMVKSLTHGPGLPPPWARDLHTSNGMLAEVNSHDWDTVRWLMGSDYQRVYVETANFKGAARGVTTPNFYDNVLVNIRFENGGLGSISGVCPCDYGYDARVEIVGEKGILQIGELNGMAVVVCTDRDHGLVTPIYRTWPERFAWGYIREMEHFIQSIQTGNPPRVGGVEGRWAVAGVLAATRSFLEDRPVYLKEVLTSS